MYGEVDTRKNRLLRKMSSRSEQSEEMKLIKSISNGELSMPDDLLVSELFNNFKLIEFITAILTLIGI
jgi:hypothetical protein